MARSRKGTFLLFPTDQLHFWSELRNTMKQKQKLIYRFLFSHPCLVSYSRAPYSVVIWISIPYLPLCLLLIFCRAIGCGHTDFNQYIFDDCDECSEENEANLSEKSDHLSQQNNVANQYNFTTKQHHSVFMHSPTAKEWKQCVVTFQN